MLIKKNKITEIACRVAASSNQPHQPDKLVMRGVRRIKIVKGMMC